MSILRAVSGALTGWRAILEGEVDRARYTGGWSIGISAVFAVLTAVLLVAVPVTLYMLAHSPAASF